MFAANTPMLMPLALTSTCLLTGSVKTTETVAVKTNKISNISNFRL